MESISSMIRGVEVTRSGKFHVEHTAFLQEEFILVEI